MNLPFEKLFGPDLAVVRDEDGTRIRAGAESVPVGPVQGRALAAYLIACAEADEAAVTDAEVAGLSAALRSAGAGLVTVAIEDIARTALQWMREQRGGRP